MGNGGFRRKRESGGGEINLEFRPLTGFAMDVDDPLVTADDSMNHAESESGSLSGAFGGEEGFENAFEDGGFDAGSSIANGETDGGPWGKVRMTLDQFRAGLNLG